jgi:hypothetical protein
MYEVKRSWPKELFSNLTGGTEENHKNLGLEIQSPGRDLNAESFANEAGVLTTLLLHSVILYQVIALIAFEIGFMSLPVLRLIFYKDIPFWKYSRM